MYETKKNNRLSFILVLLLSVVSTTWSFAPSRAKSLSQDTRKHTRISTCMVPDVQNDEELGTSDRRGFFQKVAGSLVVGGIVANGINVQGPDPFYPKPGSLNGQVIVVTGGNTGLGLESAKRLAAAGGTIIITSRSAVKGAKAVQAIKDYTSEKDVDNDNVYYLPLDLCDMESVKSFPVLLKESPPFQSTSTKPKIDVLMNNAGVMSIPELQITKDGYERTFQSNHLGHFALTALLAPLLNPDGSRIINVSSSAHLFAGSSLDLNNLNGELGYSPWGAYSQSKLMNILFTKELQKRADEAGQKITVVALHPGVVRTDLARYIIGEDKFQSMKEGIISIKDQITAYSMMYFTKSVERGANSQIWLSSGEGGSDIGGKFIFNMKEMYVTSAALDMDKAKELWAVSEKLSGVEFQL